jgi:diguanylate cyclase (GGDEF)-like protein/PAS domain S-box-containing protein
MTSKPTDPPLGRPITAPVLDSVLDFAPLWHTSLTDRSSPHAQDVLRLQERAIAALSSGVTIADMSQPDCPVVYCNAAFTAVTGYTPGEVLGRNCRFLQGPDTDPEAVSAIRHAVREGRPCTVTFKNYRKDRTPFWNELTLTPVHDAEGRLTHFIGVQHDVSARREAEDALTRVNAELEARVQARTSELERANAQLRHDAFHDALTGLANRALFHDRLAHALEREKRNPQNGFAVLYLDFDRFKVINDSLGHSVGDQLLVAIAHRFTENVRPGDTVARLGGDEFTMLLEDLSDLSEAVHVTERLQASFSRPFQLGEHELHISASIGVVPSGVGYSSAEEILRDADLAMYRAKALGKARYVVFDAAMRERALSLLALEADLRRAVERREFEVHYQPIIAAPTGQPVGFEALVRWQHPQLGAVAPSEFIPLAEETGLVIDLDRWVLRTACAQLKAWQLQFPEQRPLSLNVNLSSQQFRRTDLVAYVEDVLYETGLGAESLRLELTETVMMSAAEAVQDNIARLKALGVQLHIDDFGTGYSSLSYLQHLPSDTLKIDRSFIDRLLTSREGEELVRTIVLMAHNLGMKVVAEGVETEAQLERLVTLGCEFVQGYFLSKPLTAADATGFMIPSAALAASSS